jgi:hypothetical protein
LSKIYAIRDKATKQLQWFFDRCVWESVEHAARCYLQGTRKWVHTGNKPRKDGGWEWDQKHFVDQDEFEIVEITSSVEASETVCKASRARKQKVIEEFSMVKGA